MHQSIAEQFEELGIEPSGEILDKCVELCLTHNISDAVEFVEQWMAYSISNLNGAEPTIPFLLEFERKDLTNFKKESKNTITAKKSNTTQFNKNINNLLLDDYDDINPIALYGGPNIVAPSSSSKSKNTKSEAIVTYDINEDDEIMDSYGCKTPKAIKTAVSKTPASRHHDVKFSPASYSPVCGTPRSIVKNSGKIMYTFGHSSLINEISWSAKKPTKITIKNLITFENEPLSNRSKYLFDNLLEKINIASDNVFERGKEICRKHFGTNTIDYDLLHPDISNHDTFKTIGTIFCEHEGALDKNSTLLVGSDDMKLRIVQLNFNKSKPFEIFPGQTVMVSGTNPNGDIIMVDEFFTERNLKLSDLPKIDESLHFVFAAGPFTHSDDLVYDPLSDLIEYCKKNKPHVLILIGPFMDTEHCMIKGNVIAETFESYFAKIITGIVEEIGSDITLCVVASNRDANADMVYPTPPINLGKNFSNVYMLPDPCIIDVNGVHIGLTATDIFEHMLNNELILSANDKVKRITKYLLHQGSFYPLSPPENSICFDSDLASKYAKIEEVPHVLLLPSKDKVFIRDVNGCLSVNPGHLSVENNGGSFGRLVIQPPKDKEKRNCFEYMACQILKV